MKRALVILLGAILLALVLVAGTAVFLGATEGGTRFLAGQAERFLPVRLTAVSGALLREIRIGKLEYELDGRHLTIDELAVSVALMPLLFESHLIVHSVRADAVTLTGTGPPDQTGAAPVLELPYMPLSIDVESADVGRVALPGAFPMQVSGSATWNGDGLVVHGLNVISDVIVGNVRGRIGTGANPAITAQANWSLPSRAWGGEGRIDGRVNSFEVHHLLRGYVSVDADGRGDLSNLAEPSIDTQVSVQDLAFGDTAVRDITGRVSGTLANLSADLTAQISTPGIEPVAATLAAYGPVSGPLTVRNVSADALGGTQQAQGSVSWSDDVRVNLGGTASNMALTGLREGLTGEVGGAFQLRYQEGLLSLRLENISGTVNQRKIEGRLALAQLSGDDGWRLDPVQLTLGENRLSGTARLAASSIEAEAQVQAPALEGLGMGVSGDVSGTVALSGDWADLNGKVALTSSRLQGFGADVEQATLQASLDSGVLAATFRTERVRRQQLDLAQLELSARGPLQDVSWNLTWAGGEGAGTLQRRDQTVELGLASAQVGLLGQPWVLQQPTRVLLAGTHVDVAPACLGSGDARVCVESLAYDAGHVDTRGEIEHAPVALLRPWLPLRLADAGYLEGNWSLSGSLDDLNGEVAVAARRLSYLSLEDQAPIALPDLEAAGAMADGALRVRLMATDENFSVKGSVQTASLKPDGALSGAVDVSATDLSPLKVFDQRIAEVAGGVQGTVALSGSLAEPRLDGRFALTDGELKLNDPEITLTDMEVQLRLDDSGTFELDGTARQKEDEVHVTAAGSGLLTPALTFNAGLEGENLRARHPDWEVTVSPDLDLAYADGRGRLRGKVIVPKAEVRVSTLPASVPSPSEDVVVVGREQGNGNGEAGRFRADVEVVLGSDVTLKAFGVTAQLEGSLQARLDARGSTTLRGTLDVTGGVLSTQGQVLTIESGSVVYNGPVDRPYIDIRAARTIDTVTPSVKVGLHIRGDANNLTSSVYSEPAMSETRALSFLVLGRDIEDQTASADSSRLVAAAINLGLSRSGGIASELMQITGLDELSAAAEEQNSFAIVAGKRINDALYVRYTYNTLSAVGAFLVRYDLSRHWKLEANSGEQSAMDLLYSFEK